MSYIEALSLPAERKSQIWSYRQLSVRVLVRKLNASNHGVEVTKWRHGVEVTKLNVPPYILVPPERQRLYMT
jgi:hypothetical protein